MIVTTFFSTTVGQDIEFKRTLADAGWTLKDIERVIKHPECAEKMLAAVRATGSVAVSTRQRRPSRFAQYKQHLNSLGEQKALLVAFNAQAGDLAVPSRWLEVLSTSSRHNQSLEDLEIFVVWCGTLERTLRYTAALMKFCQGRVWNSGFRTDAQNMRLHAQAFAYDEVGVYRVRVNMVDNWTPERERSINDVYGLAATKTGYLLASVEGIFGYALQKRGLIRLQDGINLPYTDCPGIQQGDGFDYAVSFDWGNSLMAVNFNSWNACLAGSVHSAPSVRGVPRRVA